jgi:hypothetical protein
VAKRHSDLFFDPDTDPDPDFIRFPLSFSFRTTPAIRLKIRACDLACIALFGFFHSTPQSKHFESIFISGEEIASKVKKDRGRKTNRINPIHDATVSFNDRAIVLNATVAFDG